MRSLDVVPDAPGFARDADLREGRENSGVRDFSAIAAIEAFDVGALIRFHWLHKLQQDAVCVAPITQGVGDEFGAVVAT